MTRYYLGVDIGGTKTHALIADENGKAVGFGQAGNGKRQGDDYSRVGRILALTVGQAMQAARITTGQIAGAGFGISDFDWPSQRDPHLAQIATLGLNAPVELVNDAIPGLIAGASEGWGVSIIAGTGCNCWGRNAQHRYGHVTGFGLPFGEGAGGWEVMLRVQQVVAAAWYKGGPATALTQMLIDAVGASSEDDLIEGLTVDHYRIAPLMAPRVFEIARQGDAVAQEVVRWAGQQLAALGVAVARQLDLLTADFEVVLSGSMFKAGAMLIDPLREALNAAAPGARLTHLSAPPVVGAVLLGMECGGLDAVRIQAARHALLASPIQRISESMES